MQHSKSQARSHPKAQAGGTIVGFIVGLVIGLAIAVIVALVITRAPIPFINKLVHAPDQPPVDAGNLPDPNKSLYARDAQGEGTAANTGNPNTPAVPPGANAAMVITPAVSPASASTPGNGNGALNNPPLANATTNAQDGKPALLQAGAFTSSDAAESMKAKLALLGLEGTISPITRDGASVYRVRLGPYQHIDDLIRVRQLLAENGIDAGIVPATR